MNKYERDMLKKEMNEIERNMCYTTAAAHYDNGDYSAAISECSTGISKGTLDARVYNIRAYSYIQQGEILKARLDFDTSLKLDPADSEIRGFRDTLKSKGY